MPVLTILCHGTDNSRDTATSGGNTLVISKIAELLAGAEGTDWLLLEGAGTANLVAQGVASKTMAGIVWGAGVEANAAKAVKFVTDAFGRAEPQIERTGNRIRFTDMTVNLAGHSRGSITCYKIAYALRKQPAIKVNIFAIDPVPGNNGSINKEMHDHIQLGDNVKNSFLMLAESEHRLNFRPYVDSLYCLGLPSHKFDTIPGTHGGINELGGGQCQAADIVLSRAVKFLQKNGSVFDVMQTMGFIRPEPELLNLYSAMMMRIKDYKKFASVNPFKVRTKADAKNIAMNLLTTTLSVEKHRIANVAGDRATWGGAVPKGVVAAVKAKVNEWRAPAETEGRGAHEGLNLSEAIKRMTGNEAHAKRPNRFFANHHHEKLFERAYPGISAVLKRVERSAKPKDLRALDSAVAALGDSTDKQYLEAYHAARVHG